MMMKNHAFLPLKGLALLLACLLHSCAEEESGTLLPTDGPLQASASDPTVPVLNSVSTNGLEVTLNFTNNGAPQGPEGGFELVLDGQRTYTNITPRVFSSDLNVTMTFTLDNPGNYCFQVYARWNSGYKYSNELCEEVGGSTGTQQTVLVDIADASNTYTNTDWNHLNQNPASGVSLTDLKNTEGNATGINMEVTSSGFSANDKGPQTGDDSGAVPDGVMKNYYYVSTTTDQTIEFSNLDASATYSFTFYGGSSFTGDRTAIYTIGSESVSLNASQNTSQTVTLSDITADASGKVVVGIRKASGASYGFLNAILIDVNGGNNNGGGNTGGDDLPSALPPLQLVKGYEFEDNIGRNVTASQDDIKVHHLAREGGIVESVDGGVKGTVGAYKFRIERTGYSGSGKFYRQELEPTNLPEPHFRDNRRAYWEKEYVYQIRLKLTNNYDIGREYVGFMSGKNDYSIGRNGISMRTAGDHYRFTMNYDPNPGGTNDGITGGAYDQWRRVHKSADGVTLERNVDYNGNTFMDLGTGYKKNYDDLGEWVVWTWHVKWSYGSTGFVRIYKNDDLFLSYNGANSFNDNDAPYFKFGLYNSYWKNPANNTGSDVHESYVDYFRIYVPQ